MIPGAVFGPNTNLMPRARNPTCFFQSNKKPGVNSGKPRTKVEKKEKSGTTRICEVLPSKDLDCSVSNNQVSSLAAMEAAQTLGKGNGASVTCCHVPDLGLVTPPGFQITFLDFSGLSDCEIKDLKSILAGEKKCPPSDVPVVSSSKSSAN